MRTHVEKLGQSSGTQEPISRLSRRSMNFQAAV